MRIFLYLGFLAAVNGYNVFHIQATKGRYYIATTEDARALCKAFNGKLANLAELEIAQTQGMDSCHCGYLEDGVVALPLNHPRPGCGDEPGIRYCPSYPSQWGHYGWDAYCVPEKPLECSNEYGFGSAVTKYKQYPDDWANLFLDMTFPADGKVTGWTYYSLRSDLAVYVAVYRPLGDNKFLVVGRNQLPLGRVGRVDWIVEEKLQISVKAGDFIGIHYDTAVDYDNKFYTVIPYAQGPRNLCAEDGSCIPASELSTTWYVHRHEQQLFHKRDYVLDLNKVTEKSKIMRKPALRATMCAVNGAILPTQPVSSTTKATTTSPPTTPHEDLTPEPSVVPTTTAEPETTTTAEPETTTTAEPETTTTAEPETTTTAEPETTTVETETTTTAEPETTTTAEPETTTVETETTTTEPETTTTAEPETTTAEPETTTAEPETTTTAEPETTTTAEPETTTAEPVTTTTTPIQTTTLALTTPSIPKDVTEVGEIGEAEPVDTPCHFPFMYRKQMVYACTMFQSDKPWCSTEEVYDGSHWRYCHEGDLMVKDMPCHFPFTYNGEKFNTCTRLNSNKAWCSVAPEYGPYAWKYCADDAAIGDDRPCHYPFEFNGKLHNMCIKSGSSNYWCATAEKYSAHAWRNCQKGDRIPDDMPCHFPFVFEGKEQETCIDKGDTKHWCSVEAIYSSENWRYCREGDRYPVEPPCHFPFEYNGKQVTTCISDNANKPWCSLMPKYDTQNWRYCRKVDIFLVHGVKVATVAAAKAQCTAANMVLAMERDVTAAYDNGMETCMCGWITNGAAVNLIRNPRKDCGENSATGIVVCPPSAEGYVPICVRA